MTTTSPTPRTTLVLGGTGKTGRRVAARLVARGHRVRIGSRRGEPPFDWADPSGWRAVLRGVGAAYVAYYPDLAFPGAATRVGVLAGLAVDEGVDRLVLLSGRGEEEALVSEQALRAAGADWTVVRSSWFAQNFSEHFLLDPVLAGEIALPAGEVAEPFVDLEDVADVAVAALTGQASAGEVYEVTGPRLLTFHDAAAEISRATGRDVRYVPVTAAEYAAAATGHGVPAEEADGLADLFTRVLDGRNAHLTDGVRRALGRAPREFADYVRAAAATGVWEK
jgi:uncharacterized protein YbjT (DUF2867 family)